jgi:hypothetical protein
MKRRAYISLVVLAWLATGVFAALAQEGSSDDIELTIYPLTSEYQIGVPSDWVIEGTLDQVLSAAGQEFGMIVFDPGFIRATFAYDKAITPSELLAELLPLLYSRITLDGDDIQETLVDGRVAAYIDFIDETLDVRMVAIQMSDETYGVVIFAGLQRWQLRGGDIYEAILASYNSTSAQTTVGQTDVTSTRPPTRVPTSTPEPTPVDEVIVPLEGTWRIDLASVDNLALCRSGFSRFGEAVEETEFTADLIVRLDGAVIIFGANALSRVGETEMYVGTITTPDWTADVEVAMVSEAIMIGRVTSVIMVTSTDDVCVDQVRVLLARES